MNRRVISTQNAPAAIGPYSQAITAGGLVFCSGQIALHPETGDLVNKTIEAETTQVMKNLAAVLDAAGSSLDQIVKTTIYLTDLGDYAAVNECYAQFFDKDPPARAAVEVSALPKGVRVEIDAIAVCLK
jgi:2-iminobutanoate/2-iminopropanoate deaminase